ncbi:tRNA (pseudouridine(54)-N(1))-methyltransferase TrmY [Haloarchaeobius sp. DYHT-AS-18]|uniref:tRNA (pseudouridine(54)-N(1))-methyltransferase TrmY n=1 Tax=Haloarchaeobius sp. DYHT-AS-18 TaxID=3446117 RepID=UPI003EBD8F05
MRQFIVLGHEVPTTADFSLDALASEAGRMDLLARCLNAAFLASHGIREDVRVHLVIGDEYTVTVDGSEVRNLHPDERSIAALVRNALDHREDAIGHMPAEASPGVSIRRFGFETILEECARDGTVIQLHEDGDPASEAEIPENPVFVLSDHTDFTDEEESLLADAADLRLRLGPRTLHADHSITVAHHWLDTQGYQHF